jgi:hypothetical protein
MDMRQRPKAPFTGRTRLLALLAALPLVASGCFGGGSKAGGQATQHVTVLHMANVNGEVEPALRLFADAVARRSGGSLRIDVGVDYRPGDPQQEKHVIGDVRAGRVQLAWVGARAWDTVGIKSFRAVVAPFLVDSYPLEEKVLAGPMAGEMLAGVRPLGLVGLAVLPGPLRRIAAVRKTLVKPGDFAGLTVGTSASLTARATIRALGARPAILRAQGKLTGMDGLEQHLGGRFAFTQENKNACTWQYGKATLKGSELDWDFTDGGGIAPTHAENKPGEYFVWRWSLYRQVLTLRPIRPTDLTVERWQRTSSTPSKGALSDRCPPPKEALP